MLVLRESGMLTTPLFISILSGKVNAWRGPNNS